MIGDTILHYKILVKLGEGGLLRRKLFQHFGGKL
jgi:hypothetical protein